MSESFFAKIFYFTLRELGLQHYQETVHDALEYKTILPSHLQISELFFSVIYYTGVSLPFFNFSEKGGTGHYCTRLV